MAAMEPLDERLAKVLPAHFKAEKALVVRKNIQMTSNVVTEVAAGAVVKLDRVRKLPGDPKKLRGRVVEPAAGWVTVTSKNLTRVDASAAPADDREDWEYDPRDSYDHYLTRAERCAWPAAKQRAKVAKLLEKEFPAVKLPAAARTSWSVSRMRAFLESKGAKGRPHAVVGVAAGGDPWAAAQAEYRLAMEGVEREALRAVERDNRAWCKAWDEDRFRPENIAAAAAEAVRQVDELLPPPPPDSIAAAEPSEMLKRWAASPFHPDQNPSYLRQPEEG